MTVKVLAGPSSSESARHVDTFEGVANKSSEDDHNLWPRRRGHDYRNIQARENGRIHLGDNTYGNNTYIAQQIVYSEQKQRSGVGEEAKEIEILDALAFEHMGTRLASISAAQDRTCRWFFDTSEYSEWRQGSHHRILWIKGKPGSGKSTLMATAVQQASRDFKDSVVASFFFNTRGDELGRTTAGMYRSLLHQILSNLQELPSGIPARVSPSTKNRGWALPMLQNLLRSAVLHLGHRRSLVCYIDALDECDVGEIRDATQHLEELRDLAASRNIRFLICFASRHYPNITIQHHQAINLDVHSEHNHDISKYINSKLRIPDTLGIELHDSLMARCAGVFLWVVLTVRSLNKLYDQGGTRSQLRSQMRDTPDEVQDLFRRLLQDKDEHLLPILQWVLHAQRPMNVEELYFGVMASTGRLATGACDRSEIDTPRMQKFLMTSSTGLVEFWGREVDASLQASGRKTSSANYSQLIHESLREYLLGSGLLQLDPSMGSQVKAISHARLAEWCVSYIEADSAYYTGADFCRYESFSRYPLLHYITCNAISHLEIAYADNVLPASTLEQFANLWLTCKLDRLSSCDKSHCAVLLYNSLVKNSDKYQKGDFGTIYTSLDAGAAKKEYEEPALWLDQASARRQSLSCLSVAHAPSVDLARLFRDRKSSYAFFCLIREALLIAAAEGNHHILDVLLHCLAAPQGSKCLDHALLSTAVLALQASTTKLLLERGANPNRGWISILYSLARAEDPVGFEGDAVRARFEVASILLDYGAATKVARGALAAASGAGRSGLVQLLVARGVAVSCPAVRKV